MEEGKKSYKDILKKKLYGGIWPYFYCDYILIEKLSRALEELNIKWIAIKDKECIDIFLTEEEAKFILEFVFKNIDDD